MTLHNINTIARYEVRLLRRSWLFRIFALLAILGITMLLLGDQTHIFRETANIWSKVGISSFMPFTAVYYYNIAQSIIVIFLAGSFLKRDKKLDTAEVIYVRPMSNADYIIGKTWGIIKVFISLNIIILIFTAFLNVMVNHSPFSMMPYLLYILLISIPSLLFVLGLAFTLMCLLKNQAVTFIVMLGITGTVFFYMTDTLYGVFDFFGVNIPAIFSDVTGHADIRLFILQRLIYFLAGIGLICLTIAFIKRLPHRPWKTVIVRTTGGLFLLSACTTGLLYVLHYNHQLKMRAEYATTFNKYTGQEHADILAHDLFITPRGNQLSGKSIVKVKNHYSHPIGQVLFYLNPGLQLTGIEASGTPVPFKREHQVIIAEQSLTPGQELLLTLHYTGNIDETICYTDVPEKEHSDNKLPGKIFRFGKRYAWSDHTYTLLTPECLWYPVSVPPVNPGALYNIRKNFTAFTLNVEYDGKQTIISQGDKKKEGNKTSFTNSALLPGISLTIGDYEKKSLQVDSIHYEIYYFKGHDFFSGYFTSLKDTLPALLREIKDAIEVSDNRNYPFNKFVLAEVPVQFASHIRNWKGYTEYVMPEILFVPERGVTLEYDLKAEEARGKEWKRHDPGAPDQAEMDINMFRRFVSVITQENMHIGWDWQNQYINPYNILPMFFNHSSFIRSDQFPVIDIVIHSMQQTTADNGINFRAGIINDKQRANLYLETHSLEQAIADKEIKPEILYELIKMKGQAVGNYITTRVSTEDLQDFLKDFFQRYQFRNIPFETFCQELKKQFGVDLNTFIPQWYTEDHSPMLLIREVDANQVVIEEETKYQTKFKIYNPSDVDAIITASVMEGGMRGNIRREMMAIDNGNSGNVFNYIIPGGEAYEIRLINDERPVSLTVNLNISHNLPNVHIFSFPKIENVIQDTSSGIFNISPSVFSANLHEIIIDNEDPGFKTVSSNNKHKLKDLFRKKDDEKYKNFTPWWMPSQWTAIAADYCYGETVNSAVYKNKGSGANQVVWEADIPKDGYYEVFIWNPKTNMRFSWVIGRHRGREERNQTYILRYNDEKEEFTLDMEHEDNGWISLGNFYIQKGKASITLTDQVSGNYVIADAVKFTLADE